MKKDCMISAVRAYLAGEITRDALSVKIKNHRAATQLRCASYADLLLDGIEQKLSAVPEQSYGDGELKHVLDVLEGRQMVQDHFYYYIPPHMIDEDVQRLSRILENDLSNLAKGKTYPIQVGVRMTNGALAHHLWNFYITQEEYDFCEELYHKLSADTQGTVVKSILNCLLSMVYPAQHLTIYFSSVETIDDDYLIENLRRGVQVLCGKRPVYVSLYGYLDNLRATILL